MSNSGYCRDLQNSTPFLDLQCRYRRLKNSRVALVLQNVCRQWEAMWVSHLPSVDWGPDKSPSGKNELIGRLFFAHRLQAVCYNYAVDWYLLNFCVLFHFLREKPCIWATRKYFVRVFISTGNKSVISGNCCRFAFMGPPPWTLPVNVSILCLLFFFVKSWPPITIVLRCCWDRPQEVWLTLVNVIPMKIDMMM